MRLLILFISFLISGIANGQILNASAPYRVRASGCSGKLLDCYSGAAAAYSLRLLDADYAGSAIRVRRSSDNTESDIGFTAGGDLDTAAMKTFVGTGGTDTGYVTTWYDQSGNSRDLSQSTASEQMRILTSGVVDRTSNSVGIRDESKYMTTSATGWVQLNTRSDFFVFDGVTNFTNGGLVVYAPSSGSDFASSASEFYDDVSCCSGSLGIEVYGDLGNYLISPNTPFTTRQLLSHVKNSGSGEMWQNNSSCGTDSYSLSATNSGVLLVGGRYLSGSVHASYRLNCYLQEIIIYNSDQSANRASIQTNINSYWQVY